MLFINSKVSIQVTPEQEKKLKTRLGQAISVIPGKSEQWLMTGFEDNYHLYFRGENSEPSAFIEVQIYGTPSASAMEQLTGEITQIFNEALAISPDHIYISYHPTDFWGWNGNNF